MYICDQVLSKTSDDVIFLRKRKGEGRTSVASIEFSQITRAKSFGQNCDRIKRSGRPISNGKSRQRRPTPSEITNKTQEIVTRLQVCPDLAAASGEKQQGEQPRGKQQTSARRPVKLHSTRPSLSLSLSRFILPKSLVFFYSIKASNRRSVAEGETSKKGVGSFHLRIFHSGRG